MDAKTLHTILREEKARLGLAIRHKVKSYRGVLPVEGAVLLATDDVFQLTVKRGTMELLYHLDKLPALTDRDGRLMIRHELCHVLDRLEGKIGHELYGFKPSGPYLIESELMNAVITETTRSYYEFAMARRYVKLFGLEEFATMNEIGMDEFLTLTHNLVQQFLRPAGSLEAYVLYGIVFGTLKEVVKMYFYRPRDLRFPGGMWDLTEWLCQDYGYLESLAISWKQKSELLTFIALAIFENFELPSAFDPAITRHKENFTCQAYPIIGNASPLTQTIHDRWSRRFNELVK